MVNSPPTSTRVIFAAGSVLIVVFFDCVPPGPLPTKWLDILLGVAVLRL